MVYRGASEYRVDRSTRIRPSLLPRKSIRDDDEVWSVKGEKKGENEEDERENGSERNRVSLVNHEEE